MQNNPHAKKIRHIGQQSAKETPEAASINKSATLSGNGYSKAVEGNTKRSKKGKPMKKVLWVLLALLIVGGAVFLKFYLDINNPATLFSEQPAIPKEEPAPLASATPAVMTANTPEPTIDPETYLLSQADMELMKDRVNILVLGIDESAERSTWGSFRTDTMLLLTIDFNSNKVDMVSIPRDSYVKIANSKGELLYEGEQIRYGKINSAFSSGGGAQKNGFGYSMGTVSYLLGGLPIHYYIGFNMTVVKEVVDAMGGVDYDVDVEVNMNGRQLLPGVQHLNGQAVLDYARQRKGSSDIARIDRQQRILTEILKKLKQTGQIAALPDIYKALEQNIETNLNFKQISALALLALRMDMSALSRHTVAGGALNIDSISYWGLHAVKLEKLIKEIFGVSVVVDSEIDISNVRSRIEASRALLAEQLGPAANALEKAELILSKYKSWLGESTLNELISIKSRLEDAIEDEDRALIDAYALELDRLCTAIIAKLEEYGQ